jgi:hypothetical protein
MMHVYGWTLSALLCFFTLPAFAEISCECPKLGCDPCSVQQSIKFYTDKCGPNDSKVKSCARPRCIPIETATNECPHPPSANSGPRQPIVIQAATATAPEPEAAKPADSIGKVKVISGSISIVHKDGKEVLVTKDTDLFEEDTVKSGADGAALVNFAGGNKLHVHPDTQIAVREFKDPKIESSRKVLLQMIKGKIRNQVEQKYNGKTSYYRVQTKAAVAGVRGTDFIVEHHESGDLETTIQTFKGKVILSDLLETQSREVSKGEQASLKADPRDIKHGILSEVIKIDEEKLKNLDHESRVDIARRKTPKDSAICKDPKGDFNQCAWSTVKGTCVRHRCNGNGVWAEETRLSPEEGASACPATGNLVKDCDY